MTNSDDSQFVDRIDELEWVLARVRLLLARRLEKRTLIFTGEQGIGKSWFLNHLRQQLHQYNDLYLFHLDLAEFAGADPALTIQAILQRLNKELLPQPLGVLTNLAEVSRLLMNEMKEQVLTQRPLVLLVDAVYEASWELLALLEQHLLGVLAVDPSVLIILAGRGQPFSFTAPELRLRAEVYTLGPFPLEWTKVQLQQLGFKALPATEIQKFSFGNPKANRVLAESPKLEDAFYQLVEDMVALLPPDQVARALDYMLALAVPRFFDYSIMQPVLAAYYDDLRYLQKPRPEIVQMADLLIRPGYAYWDKDRSFYVLHTPTRHWCVSYIKAKHPDHWRRITQALLELFQGWSIEVPRNQAFWAAEIAYHQAELTT